MQFYAAFLFQAFLTNAALGRHSKQAGDEGDLILDVSLPHPMYLPFANHVHHFVTLERPPCRFHRKEAHPWLDQPLEKAVVLLDQVIQVFDQALVRYTREVFRRL